MIKRTDDHAKTAEEQPIDRAAPENDTAQTDDELVIDTSKMSEGKRDAMEVAEAARESWAGKSFAQQLFMGRFDAPMIADFPTQSAEDRKIGDEMLAHLSEYLPKHLDPDKVDATRTIPEEVVNHLFAKGLFAMKVPAKYGGLGYSQVNYNRVMALISSYCGSTAALLSAHQSIGVPVPLKLFGTEAQKKKWFPRFRKDAISAFALTEPEVGSDPAKMSTEAVPTADGKHYILNGEKLWCTNGPIADVLVVMAKTPPKMVNGRERKQITAFIVEKSMPGFEVAHRCDFMGLRGIQNGLLRFNNMKVPAENILWGEGKGLKLALTTLNTGRLTLPACCTGMAKQCLTIARRWGQEREQWGLAIGLHEAGRRKVAEIAATTLAMEAITMLTSHWADRGDVDIRLEAAMAKLVCSEYAWQLIDDTVQIRGGRGYERAESLRARGEYAYPVERMMRDCRINRIVEGTSEIMRLFMAREAMDPHLRVAADLMKKHVPFGTKMKAGLNLAAYYGRWYPAQWINGSRFSRHRDMGKLGTHFSYVGTTAHKLARTIFHYMGMYQDRLERKQNILGHLMDIGSELFAISATVSYANKLAAEHGDDSAVKLADVFARLARRRIEGHFAALSHNDDKHVNPVAKEILNDGMTWLEKGVVPLDD